MSVINATITRAWRNRSAGDRIHYVVQQPDRTERRLWTDPGEGLYTVLDSWLASVPGEETDD
jgi:hypothetical protein